MKKLILVNLGFGFYVIVMIGLAKVLPQAILVILCFAAFFAYVIFVLFKSMYTYVIYGKVDLRAKVSVSALLDVGARNRSALGNRNLRLIAENENRNYDEMRHRRNIAVPLALTLFIISPAVILFILLFCWLILQSLGFVRG